MSDLLNLREGSEGRGLSPVPPARQQSGALAPLVVFGACKSHDVAIIAVHERPVVVIQAVWATIVCDGAHATTNRRHKPVNAVVTVDDEVSGPHSKLRDDTLRTERGAGVRALQAAYNTTTHPARLHVNLPVP